MGFNQSDNALMLFHCFAELKLPARVGVEQAAKVLGFAEHDVPILVAEKLLKPLGHPVANAPKYFSSAELIAFAVDRVWLDKATEKISQHWRRKRQRKLISEQPTQDGRRNPPRKQQAEQLGVRR